MLEFFLEVVDIAKHLLDHTFLRKQMRDFSLCAFIRVCFSFILECEADRRFPARASRSHKAYQYCELFSGIYDIFLTTVINCINVQSRALKFNQSLSIFCSCVMH